MGYKQQRPIVVSEGGTGQSSFLLNGIVFGNGTSGLNITSVGTNGQVLLGATSGAPAFGTLTSSSLSYTTGANTLAINITAPVSIANGGTNATSMSTSTGIVKYDGTSLVTSSTAKIDSSNRTTNTSQPAFLAYKSSNSSNVTGDSTAYTVIFDTSVKDQNSNYNTGTGTFTAPVTGMYLLSCSVELSGVSSSYTSGTLKIITTNRSYTLIQEVPGAISVVGSAITFSGTVFADMVATQTATVQVQVGGSTKSVTVDGVADARTYFSG